MALTIAWLTLTPAHAPEMGSLLSDNVYHCVAFAALVFPTARLYARSLVWILPLAVIFGGVIELIQPHVGRDAEAADFLADLVGLALGTALGLLLRARANRRA